MLAAMGSRLEPKHVPLPAERKAVEVLRRLADTSKAKRLLRFEAQVPLEEGLARLVRWLDENIDAVR
jgi:UDP-glucose 4-epimerase